MLLQKSAFILGLIMQKFGKSNAIVGIAGIYVAVSLISATAMAASHIDTHGLRGQNPGIDPFITGANNGSLKLKSLAPDSIDKGHCPLCYHRELLKKNKNFLPKELEQPYPGG